MKTFRDAHLQEFLENLFPDILIKNKSFILAGGSVAALWISKNLSLGYNISGRLTDYDFWCKEPVIFPNRADYTLELGEGGSHFKKEYFFRKENSSVWAETFGVEHSYRLKHIDHNIITKFLDKKFCGYSWMSRNQKIQIMKNVVKDEDSLISNFDLSSCAIAYNDGTFYIHDLFLDTFNTKVLHFVKQPEYENDANQVYCALRILKYIFRYNLKPDVQIKNSIMQSAIKAREMLSALEVDIPENELTVSGNSRYSKSYNLAGNFLQTLNEYFFILDFNLEDLPYFIFSFDDIKNEQVKRSILAITTKVTFLMENL